jgi:prepilin-type N-terminal cleavage/methylation domain-containing protein
MFLSSTNKGYSLIEILVVLVILGLITALVIPNVTALLGSRERAVKVKELNAMFAMMPLKATTQINGIRLGVGNVILEIEDVEVTKEIVVLPNGYCIGGEVYLIQTQQTYAVLPPLCELQNITPERN